MKVLFAVLALALAVFAQEYDGVDSEGSPAFSLDTITFTLYNKKLGNNGIQMYLNNPDSIKKAGFDPKLPVYAATHGFMADACGDSVQCLRKVFITKGDCNFISIDWSQFSTNMMYDKAARSVRAVGLRVSKFFSFLRNETKFDIKKLHVMGHNLGAQVMSFVSDEFPGEKVGRITGLDPAGPIFESLPNSERLDPSDALFVDAIHTSTVYIGGKNPVGTVDFYPNGGSSQPGCDKFDFTKMSNMAHRYFAETIRSGKNYEAVKCATLKDAENGTCSGEKAPMGIGATAAKPGLYYTKITQDPGGC